jgi:hypothetical protein
MADLSHRPRSPGGQLLPDPAVDAVYATTPADPADVSQNLTPAARARGRDTAEKLAKAAKDRRYRERRARRVVETTALPGMAPSPFAPKQLPPKERHAQSLRAIERAQGAVDLVFDFTEHLIRAGTEVVDKIRRGKEVSEAEARVITEARQAANKLIDKCVPDIIAEGAGKGGQVQINFGAPLARLMQTGPATIDLTPQETPDGPAGD